MKNKIHWLAINFLVLILMLLTVELGYRLLTDFKLIKAPAAQKEDPEITFREIDPSYKIQNLKPLEWKSNRDQFVNLVRNDLDYQTKDTFKINVSKEGLLASRGLVRSKQTQAVIYDVTYSYQFFQNFDSLVRRSLFSSPGRKSFAIHFGDSWVFGEGVEDHQTLPSFLNQEMRTIENYNFGRKGFGPNDHIFQFEYRNDQRQKVVTQKNGILFYHYLPFHLQRLRCDLDCYRPNREYLRDKPEYRLVDSKLVLLREHFRDSNFAWFYENILGNSRLLEDFGFGNKTKATQEDMDLALSLINQIFASYQSHLGLQESSLRKVIVLHQGTPKFQAEYFKRYGVSKGIVVLDYSDIQYEAILGDRAEIPVDHHPSPYFYQLLARLIAVDLQKMKLIPVQN